MHDWLTQGVFVELYFFSRINCSIGSCVRESGGMLNKLVILLLGFMLPLYVDLNLRSVVLYVCLVKTYIKLRCMWWSFHGVLG